MKRALLFALILPGIMVAACSAAPESGATGHYTSTTAQKHANRSVTVTRTPVSRLPAVAGGPSAPVAQGQSQLEGVIPRVATADRPIEMFNPLAPSQYGTAQSLVVYTEHDNVNTSENESRLQPQGIRFLTIRPLW